MQNFPAHEVQLLVPEPQGPPGIHRRCPVDTLEHLERLHMLSKGMMVVRREELQRLPCTSAPPLTNKRKKRKLTLVSAIDPRPRIPTTFAKPCSTSRLGSPVTPRAPIHQYAESRLGIPVSASSPSR